MTTTLTPSYPCNCCAFNCYCGYYDYCFDDPTDPGGSSDIWGTYPEKFYGGDGRPIFPYDYPLNAGFTTSNYYWGAWIHKPYPVPITQAVWDPKLRRFLGPESNVSVSGNCLTYDKSILGDIGPWFGDDLLGYQSVSGHWAYGSAITANGGIYIGISVSHSKYPDWSTPFQAQFYLKNEKIPYTFIQTKTDKYNGKCRLLARAFDYSAYQNETFQPDQTIIDFLEANDNWDLIDEVDSGYQNPFIGGKSITLNYGPWPVELRVGCLIWAYYGSRYWGRNCIERQQKFSTLNDDIQLCGENYVCGFGNPNNSGLSATKVSTSGQASFVSNPISYSTNAWCQENHGEDVTFTDILNVSGYRPDADPRNGYGWWTYMAFGCFCGWFGNMTITSKYKKIYSYYGCPGYMSYGPASYSPLTLYGYYSSVYCQSDRSTHPCYNCNGDALCIDYYTDPNGAQCFQQMSINISPDVYISPNPDAIYDYQKYPCGKEGRSQPMQCPWTNYYGFGFARSSTNFYVGGNFSNFQADNYFWPISNDVNAPYTIPGIWTNVVKSVAINLVIPTPEESQADYLSCNDANGSLLGFSWGCVFGSMWGGYATSTKPCDFVLGSMTVERV